MHLLNRHVITLLLCLLVTRSAYAQDEELRTGDLPPHTTLVSEEVARQTLVTLGLQHVSTLRAVGDRFVANAEYEGRVIDVEIDRRSGVVRRAGDAVALAPARALGNEPVEEQLDPQKQSSDAELPSEADAGHGCRTGGPVPATMLAVALLGLVRRRRRR
jgi:MYXO-CTERM domain-containing protein